MYPDAVLSALVGLMGAVSSNGPTAQTGPLVLMALTADPAARQALVEAIHREKFTISPGCAACAAPCGNTADFDFGSLSHDAWAVRQPLLDRAVALAAALRGRDDIPADAYTLLYRAIAYLGYDLDPQLYESLGRQLDDARKGSEPL